MSNSLKAEKNYTCTQAAVLIPGSEQKHLLFFNKQRAIKRSEGVTALNCKSVYLDDRPQSFSITVLPWCVVNEGLGLIFRELVGLELINGGYSRPAVLCGSACGGTFNLPIRVWYYHGSWTSFSRCQRGYMSGLMGLKAHIESSPASMSAGGSTDLAA